MEHLAPLEAGDTPKHCVLLHGWGSSGRDMQHWASALRDTPAGRQFDFWIPTYDTAWRTFPQSARGIKVLLENTSFDFSHTLILGYSMGGLVARELARTGFPFQQLVTLCSPHHGAAPWIPLIWRRSNTLRGDSALLRDLNSNTGDFSLRSRYHFWGMTYNDPCGPHQHDGIVELPSAMGERVAGTMHREIFSLDFKVPVVGARLSSPHVYALFPTQVPRGLKLLSELMQEI